MENAENIHYHHESYCRKCNEKDNVYERFLEHTPENANVLDAKATPMKNPTIESVIYENAKLSSIISALEERIADIEEASKCISPMIEQIRNRNNSLIAAINFAITEYPSNPASKYLESVMENFFKK